MNTLESMKTRKSVRTYLNRPVAQDQIDVLVKSFDSTERLNDNRVTLVPMSAETVGHAMTGLVGSYGSIKNAPSWIIGLSEEGPRFQENFGYRFEQFILECTGAGLGTCWVGGFFKISKLDPLVPKEAGQHIVCISPLGYAANHRAMEKGMRSAIGANKRKPIDERVFFKEWGKPASEYLSAREKIRKIIDMARWAPSASNKQPCHYVIDHKKIILTVLTSIKKNYPSFIAKDRQMNLNFHHIDAGIAMCHVKLAAKELGIKGAWSMDVDGPALRSKYGLPADAEPVGIFTF